MPDLISLYDNQSSKEIAPITFDPTVLRTAVNEKGEIVYCLSDVLAMVSETSNPRRYMSDIKIAFKKQGVQLSEIIVQYKFMATNGRRYSMLGGTREQIFRVLQEVNSPRVAPFKSWLAKLGNERLEEIENPDLAVQRGYEGYIKKGMSPEKAKLRVKTVLHRNELTKKWLDHGVNEPKEFAMLTDRESKGTFGKTTGEMKKEKSLAPTQNLRDYMTKAELYAQDASDTAISLLIEKNNPQGYAENAKEVDTGSTVGAMVLAKLKEILKD